MAKYLYYVTQEGYKVGGAHDTKADANAEKARFVKRAKEIGARRNFRIKRVKQMANPQFGSSAWRKKYAAKAKRNRAAAARKNKPKRKAKQRKKTASHRRGTAAKKKRMASMIRGNPPGNWTKVKAFRVVKKHGRAVLEVRK